MSISRLLLPFGKNPKSVNELMIALKGHLTENTEKMEEKWNPLAKICSWFFPSDSHKNIYDLLNLIREWIYGSIESEPESQQKRDQICMELRKLDLLSDLIQELPNIGFDGRKDISLIYEYVIGEQIGTRFPTVQYIVDHKDIIEQLVHYYADQQLVTICGQMIREFFRFEELKEIFFKSKDSNQQKYYLNIMDYLKSDSFIVTSDVFLTLQELFSHHKTLIKEVLHSDYHQFFDKMNEMLSSHDYYIQRKSIKLLKELLMDRNNITTMKKYVDQTSNMEIITKILKSDCLHSSFDAFLVFYLFVINPRMSQSIKSVLLEEKDSLILFIQDFQIEQVNGKLYAYEKEQIIKSLSNLQ